MQYPIAFIGAGNIAQSLIQGLLQTGMAADQIYASAQNYTHLAALEKHLGIHVTQDNKQCVEKARVIILCVKPDVAAFVLEEIKDILLKHNPLLISVAASVSTKTIENILGKHVSIVRAMPNTPAIIGAAATGLYANGLVSQNEKNMAESIFRSVGLTLWLDHEKMLNAVTALSGSGPAYVYYFMEAMITAGTELGLSEETAKLLTLQTVFGASKLALEESLPIHNLREKVTSPEGTTAAAMHVFTNSAFEETIKQAMFAAAERADDKNL